MLNGLAPADAKKWLGAECHFVTLAEGEMLFIPFGFVTWYVSLTTPHSVVLHVPVLSDSLYKDLVAPVRNEIASNMMSFLDANGNKPPFGKSMPTIKRWIASE